jgi:hypothetical protein
MPAEVQHPLMGVPDTPLTSVATQSRGTLSIMLPEESPQHLSDEREEYPPIQCDACQSALESPDGPPSFLLLDQLTVPLVGCTDHLAQFKSVCGYTTTATAEILNHRPAGGVGCPSCHLAPHSPQQPVVQVQDGAVAVLACPKHQSELITRFHAGLDTQQQLTAQFDGLS